MAGPQVSIIIPFINEYDFLREAMQSVMEQELADFELIVVGNAPIPPALGQIEIKGGNIQILHEPNSGSAFARNTGLKAATGIWIQFLDVDDLLLPGKIRRQMETPDADVVVSPHVYRFLNGRQEKSKWLAEDVWVGLLNSGLGSTSSMLWKRDALNAIGGWNTNFQSHQEYELLFRMLQAGKKIKLLDRADTIVRERRSGAITQTSKPIRNIEGVNLRELMWNYIVAQGLITPARENAFLQYLFRQLRGLFRIDRFLALEKYREHFHQKKFIPADIHIPGYTYMYRVLNFKWTETIISWWTNKR